MATVVKTWSFASDAEGLADAAVSAVAFAFQSGDSASGSGGSVGFTLTQKGQTLAERALRSATGESWETWGVPAGAIVDSVQITAWSERCAANAKLSSHNIRARLVGSGGASVHSAGELLDVALGITTDATWQAGAAGSSRAVDAGSQASNTDVRLELEYDVTTSGGGGSASTDQRFDEIELTITYTAASQDRRGHLYWAELEVPDGARRGRLYWAELEVPDGARRGTFYWAELEVPDGARRGQLYFAELEVPDAPRRGLFYWAELEVPDVGAPPPEDRRGVFYWAELEVPEGARRGQFYFAELEVPDAPRRGHLYWAVFEVPDVGGEEEPEWPCSERRRKRRNGSRTVRVAVIAHRT